MAETDDIRLLRENANQLNNLLQVISDSASAMEAQGELRHELLKYLTFIRESLERAKVVTAQLSERLGGLSRLDGLHSSGEEKNRDPSVQGQRELILLIDDEQMICELAGEMLISAGYRVASATNPFRALDLFREIKDDVSLVILDFTLPIMDGSEVFDELKKIRPDVAVMLSSGFAEQAKVRAMLAKGLRGFLPKPYTEAKLLDQVRIVLDGIRSERRKAAGA